jgi:polar amino acid transport system substrate-binding protein
MMMRTVLASMLLFTAVHVHALTFLTEENPPLNFERNGEVVGVAPNVLREMLKRAELTADFKILPWTQALALAQKDPEICVFSTVRNPEREKTLRWIGPITRGEWSIFAREGFPSDLKKLDQLTPFRVGLVNDARAAYFRSRGFTNLVHAENNADFPKMLTANKDEPGKIDLWVTQTVSARELAKKAGVSDLKIVFSTVMSQDYWLACNPQTADQTLKSLMAAIAAMRKDGSYFKMLRENP